MSKKKIVHEIDGRPFEFSNAASSTEGMVLEERPNDYINARDLRNELDVSATTARNWRIQGKLRAKSDGATWSYSRHDLLKLLRRMYPVTIDGKRAKIRDIKPFMRDSVLKETLGDYISAKDIHLKIDIAYETLRKWRNNGKVCAMKIGTTWYYSMSDIIGLITIRKVV